MSVVELRPVTIGGSQAAAAAGVDPYKSPVCPLCGEQYENAGAHIEACRGCRHRWSRVPPVVHVVGDPEPDAGTYNAVCTRCGTRAWLHWPPLRRRESQWTKL